MTFQPHACVMSESERFGDQALRRVMRLVGVCVASAALAGIAGCESGGTGESAAHGGETGKPMSVEERASAVPMQADEFGKLGYRVEWRAFPTLLPGGQIESVDILGDVLGSMDTEGVFSVIEVKSGAQRWSDQVGGPLTRFFGAVRDNQHIIVTSESEVFYYDPQTGALKNKQRLSKVASTRPVQIGEVLAYGTSSGHVVGLLTRNGFPVWGSGVTGAVDVDPVGFPKGPEVAFASQGGDVLVLDGATGRGLGRARMFAGPGAALAASDTLAYVASLDHSLYAFTRNSCQQVWRHRTDNPLRKAPVHIEGVVYCDLGESGGMTALNASTGKVLWSNQAVSGEVIAWRRNKVLAFDGSKVYALDPAKGTIIDTVAVSNIGFFKAEAMKDGTLYAVSPMGVVTKLSPK